MSQLIEVKVPDIGDFDAVPVIELFVKVGDTIAVDDAIATLESDKATMDVPSSAAGAVKEILVGTTAAVKVTPQNLEQYLGVPKYRYGEVELEDQVGIVTGLAWTEVGGDILTIEGVMMPGKGKMSVTGNLRDVMKESIQAANAYVRSRSPTSASRPRCSRRRTSTSTCPRAPPPRMARRPVWPW